MNSIGIDGRWVMYGSLGGVKVQNANFVKVLGKRLQIIGTSLRSRDIKYRSRVTYNFWKDHKDNFKNGKIKPIIDSIYNLSDI